MPEASPAGGICLTDRIERFAADDPDLVAIRGVDRITYSELCMDVRRLSAAMSEALSGTPGSARPRRVALLMPRGARICAAIVAAQRIGADYVPLDPSYPRARLAQMLQGSQASVLVGTGPELGAFGDMPDHVRPLNLEALPADLPALPDAQPAPRPGGYVMFTSGSTGAPKGVLQTAAALENLVLWQDGLGRCARGDVTAQFAPLSFDVSFQEIAATLCFGGTLVIVSESARRDPLELIARLDDLRVRRLFLPFIALRQLAHASLHRPSALTALREVHTAGEQLVIGDEIRTMFARLPECRLFNQYGPTETHVVSCHRLPDDPAEWEALPPIGTALPRVGLHVLGADGAPAPDGEEGELFVSGIALADGYVGRPDLTRERFPVLSPGGVETRCYRTGDIVRKDADGMLRYVGRADSQVKIDGYRVELAEVESVLNDCRGVTGAVVLYDAAGGAGGGIVAAITLDVSAGDASPGAVLARVRATLPAFMVPSRIEPLKTLPLTPSGKVDRKAVERILLEPRAAEPEPTGRLDHDVLMLWRHLLGRRDLRPQDNVFDHGAKSIDVIQFQFKALSRLARTVPAALVYEHPRAGDLARALDPTHADRRVVAVAPPPHVARTGMARSNIARIRARRASGA
ncbi:amino acid adenylation domain-containing protein [Salinarimonas chemoclinalis]|uniref:amino acid adenylation domain-containing protein n=1 Tax=Salinarimonas chemoclinalis TaxID=3241599 RepID=UPI00355652F7